MPKATFAPLPGGAQSWELSRKGFPSVTMIPNPYIFMATGLKGVATFINLKCFGETDTYGMMNTYEWFY